MALYVNHAFENGSPMDWEAVDGELVVSPNYDYENGSSNRQLTHWHFRVSGISGKLTLRIPPKENIYGGKRVNAFAKKIGNCYSADGLKWMPFYFEQQSDRSLRAEITPGSDSVYIARIEPYTTAHLQSLLSRLSAEKRASVAVIGKTVEARPLELITLSNGHAKRSVLIRGRAHPWEAGGNWFIEGIIDGVLEDPAILDGIDIHILPMTAKDGVVRGHTRFNVNGYDLNRGFGKDAAFDPILVPENHALIEWLRQKQIDNALPFFAMDLHDDDYGMLHIGASGIDAGFDERMAILDAIMRKHTYYTEGVTAGAGGSTFGEGLRSMFGIDGVVYELNSNWIPSAQTIPGASVWRIFGRQFATALVRYAQVVSGDN
ncbi:MAG: hypothetical protein HZC28_02350 [Spirochaetes bacterium]|nr:hypothetical protein [Spirochaetota bacterium]